MWISFLLHVCSCYHYTFLVLRGREHRHNITKQNSII
ncbi:hypothetical protein GLYMA_09G078450v4 [Glycine max]|nr:hypothetical protein GYH30_024380 [Glycine max]KRH37621.3 hypothetical protein GLYMA_09G078450v4 [Glycine max]